MSVLVVGDLVDDISVRVLDDVTAASDTNAEIRLRPGGSAGNVAAWLGHLGTDVVFCGRVGADAVDRHTRALADCGVKPYLAGDPDRTTATIVLQLDREGERTMFVDRGANRGLVPEDVPDEAWRDVTWLHLTGYSFFDPDTRPVAIELLAEARRRGARVSVDPSSVAFLRAAGVEEFLGWIDGVDLVFPNLDEARALVGSTGPQIDLDALAARFPHVVVTLGSMGAAYLAGRRAGPGHRTARRGRRHHRRRRRVRRRVPRALGRRRHAGGGARRRSCRRRDLRDPPRRPARRSGSDQGPARVAPRCAGVCGRMSVEP